MSTTTAIIPTSTDPPESSSDKLNSKNVTNLEDDSTDELTRKANLLSLSETSRPQAISNLTNDISISKFKNNYNRKSANNNNMTSNRTYQMPYSSYPYPMINSPALLPNASIQMIPQHYMYQPSFTNISNNMYSSRNSNPNNTYYLNNTQKRAYNLQKLWPHSLKKQPKEIVLDNQKSENKPDKNNKNAFLNEAISNKQELTATDTQSDDKLPDSKTPMCLINELVRFNKIKHEYVLLDEIGPAHKKIFYIMLKLGIETEAEECYTAQGSSIKKTQHAAAELALKQTKFKLPIKRDKNLLKNASNDTIDNQQGFKIKENETQIVKRIKNSSKTNPPTVRLNTLAMKLGLVANYTHSVTSYQNSIDYNLDLSQQQNIFGNQSYDYNNYTSFMSNEYKPFKYQPVQVFNNNSSILYNNKNNGQISNFVQNDQHTSKQMGDQNYPMNMQRQIFPEMRRSHQSYQIAQQIQRPKQIINVKLTFANKDFNGQGITLQIAKHDAASKALEYFTDPEKFLEAKSLSISGQNKTIKAYRPPQFYQLQEQEKKEQNDASKTENKNENDKQEQTNAGNKPKNILNSEIKSEVQLVYEYAYYLKKSVDFELVQESGPSHIKKFVTKCLIGNKETDKTSELIITSNESNSFPIETVGEGNSKKLSKKNSAIKMLVILKDKFEPLLLISSNTRLQKTGESNINSENSTEQSKDQLNDLNKKHRKNKAKNIIKIKKTSPEYGKGSINPISRLMQIQQAKKEREPIFELVQVQSKRRIEFVMQVIIEPSASNGSQLLKCEGKGSTKKIAKLKAAEAMLTKLGYQSRQPIQSALKSTVKLSPQNSEDQSEILEIVTSTDPNESLSNLAMKSEKKVKFLEDPNIKTEDSTSKLKPMTSNLINNEKKVLKANKNQSQNNHMIKQQKFKQIQQNIANNQSKIDSNGELSHKDLDIVYKIASELLDSVSVAKNNDDPKAREFFSATAELYLSKINNPVSNQEDEQLESRQEIEEKKIQFKILNGGLDSTNYKKMLEYLADTLSFKVNYQSLLGRDGSVYSYVSLSILPETDKPLNGHGTTHIESSNTAALCALQYLASRCNQNKQSASFTKTNIKN